MLASPIRTPVRRTEPTIRALLERDHTELERMFEELLAAAESRVDTFTLGRMWTEFENGLLFHLAAEEEHLFPHFEREHPELIAALREEHDDIRSQLDALDIAVDLHFVRDHDVHDLMRRVQRHVKHEAESVYAWIERGIEDEAHAGIVSRLTAALSGRR